MRYARVLLLGLLALALRRRTAEILRRGGNPALVALAGCVLLALAALGVWMAATGEFSALASHDPNIPTPGEDVGFDMVIDDDGDTIADNGPAILGPIDPCVSVSAGTDVTFDVFLDSIPTGNPNRQNNLGGFNYRIVAAPGSGLTGLTVTARDNNAVGINILTNEGTGIFLDLSTTPPAPLEGFVIAAVDLGAATAEAPPTTVRGVMTRFTVSTSGVTAGTYPMVFDYSDVGVVGVFDSVGGEVSDFDDQQSDGFDQDGDTLVDEDSLIDGYDGYGIIAVDAACPPPPPPPSVTPTPTPTPCPGPCPTPTPTPCPGLPAPPAKAPDQPGRKDAMQILPPSMFYGTVTVDCAAPAIGTTLRAKVGGNVCGQTQIEDLGAGLNYSIAVAHFSEQAGCGTDGAAVVFGWGSQFIPCLPNGTWDNTITQLHDLACTTPGGPTPTPTPTPPPCPPPANDLISDASAIPILPFSDSRDTTCATTSLDDPFCAGLGGHSVWYSFTSDGNQRIEADTFGSDYDTTLSVYSGSPGALAQVACNDQAGGNQSQVFLDAVAGQRYFVMIASWLFTPGGQLQFTIQSFVPLEIDVSIDPVDSVVPSTGLATIGGAVTCSKPASVDLSGELRQRAGRVTIRGFFSTFLYCDGETQWSATVEGQNGRYAGGRADVSVSAFAFAGGEFDSAQASATVRLKGSSPVSHECPRDGNFGFETGVPDSNVIPCWTVVDQTGGYGSWCNQTGTLLPQGPCFGNILPVPAPPEGVQAAMTNQSFVGSHVLYRCGVLRSGSISFQLYINNVAGVFVSPPSLDYLVFPNQQFRADLVTATGMAANPFTVASSDILLNLYQTKPGDPPVSGYNTITADASAYVRQEVCLRFAVVDNVFFFHAGVDDVSISLR